VKKGSAFTRACTKCALPFYLTLVVIGTRLPQAILKAYQSFTQTCGLLSLVRPREALINSLCMSAASRLPRTSRG